MDLDVEDLDAVLRFFGDGFGGDAGTSASESAPPKPAAAKKSPTRSSSPASLILQESMSNGERVRKKLGWWLKGETRSLMLRISSLFQLHGLW